MAEPDRPKITVKYGARALHAGWKRLQTNSQNMQHLFPLLGNNGDAIAPQFYAFMYNKYF
jgi:hypothetical protein